MYKAALFFIFFITQKPAAYCQAANDRGKFFADQQVIGMELTTDFRRLRQSSRDNDFQPGLITCHFPDSTLITETIRVCPRGVDRRKNCYNPPLILDFKNPTSPKLSYLGKLKLVSGCANSSYNEQLLLKEFLAYRIYNLLTTKSFNVRLLKITYQDSRKKMHSYNQYAFIMEEAKSVAKRNGCTELTKLRINTVNTDREQMTMVALYQYMIGNTDWAVPNGHNIRLMRQNGDSMSAPFVIPYDFDYSGLVNANYAIPDPGLGTASVTERVYRGFPRTMTELKKALQTYTAQQAAIFSLINTLPALEKGVRQQMLAYLGDFYSEIKDEKRIQYLFIDHARTE